MQEQTLHQWAQHLAQQTGFKLGQCIYQGEYYTKDKVRDVIYDGAYHGKPAVLKVYDDPRLTDEPAALAAFHQYNTSTILTAPQLYASEMVSPQKGWLIMEKLPDGGQFFASPLKPQEREQFVQLFVEYRRNFPATPTRPLTLAENLPAHEFHLFRISRWFELATTKEQARAVAGEQQLFNASEFIPQYLRGLALIRREFSQRSMVWCHGHFKPKELYQAADDNRFYLTDFAHTKLYPEGYELAFIVWSDWLMGGDWRMDYGQWKQGVNSWLELFSPVASQLNISEVDRLMTASLTERVIGSLLADICATDRPRNESLARTALLSRLLNELVR